MRKPMPAANFIRKAAIGTFECIVMAFCRRSSCVRFPYITGRTTMKRTILCLLLCASSLAAQTGARNGEWKTYGGDLGNTHYSPLDQINASNFNSLQIAWRFKTDNLGAQPEFNLESTPLMAKGVLYSTAGTRRAVVAIDAGTGELIWTHGEREGGRGTVAPRQLSGRGLAYWSDGREERILYVTPGYRLIALDAKTGAPVRSFGTDGAVDLKQDDDQEIDPFPAKSDSTPRRLWPAIS